MSKLKTAISLLKTPGKMVLPLANLGLFNWMNDRTYLKFVFRSTMGYKLNLSNPKTFFEKIQWLKLNDRKDAYIQFVDKITVKTIVANIIGSEYIIPTIGVWDSFDQIDFNLLPNQFVLKCNHDSGSVVICKDKATFDRNKARIKLMKHLRRDAYTTGREWPYKHVKRVIFAEMLLQSQSIDLTDYKVYCFNGVPKYCQVIKNRSTNETIDFYDANWIHQPFVGITENTENSETEDSSPVNYELMKKFATRLSENTFFCRVDFYEVNQQLYFGEITFYPCSGFGSFRPPEWNEKIGDMIKLPIDETI